MHWRQAATGGVPASGPRCVTHQGTGGGLPASAVCGRKGLCSRPWGHIRAPSRLYQRRLGLEQNREQEEEAMEEEDRKEEYVEEHMQVVEEGQKQPKKKRWQR